MAEFGTVVVVGSASDNEADMTVGGGGAGISSLASAGLILPPDSPGGDTLLLDGDGVES